MAHFAKLDENNMVIAVNVVNNQELNPLDEEASGIAFLTDWSGGYSNWKQTSYSGKIRKNYAGIGYTYDAGRDAFIAPKPFNSWILNEESCKWQAPIPYPSDGDLYTWNEELGDWVNAEAV